MPSPPMHARTVSPKSLPLMLVWKERNTDDGVTHEVAVLAAKKVGLTLEQFVHAAVAQYAARLLPPYEATGDWTEHHAKIVADSIGTLPRASVHSTIES